MKQGLTKEGFWDSMEQKYPQAAKEFYKWLDEYKKEVGWAGLFGGDSDYPKFHHLPYAMQLGIFLAYMNRFEDADDTIQAMTKDREFIDDLEGMVDCFFDIREDEMKYAI